MKLLLVTEVARILNISPERTYELVRIGALPAVRIGRQLRIDPVVLAEWVRKGGKPLPGGWRRER